MNHIKEEWLKGNTHVRRFSSLLRFMDFCKALKLTPENSEVYYDAKEGKNYIMADKINSSI